MSSQHTPEDPTETMQSAHEPNTTSKNFRSQFSTTSRQATKCAGDRAFPGDWVVASVLHNEGRVNQQFQGGLTHASFVDSMYGNRVGGS
jgi:hypothetical protein